MGLLDGMMKQALGGAGAGGLGDLMALVSKNPRILAAIAGLLSTKDASIGGSGGLGGLIAAFQEKGMGDMVSSWITTGPNPPISAAQITDVLGSDTVGQVAAKAGIPVSEAGSLLAQLLPTAIDKLTPDGTVPDAAALDGKLSSLLAMLG